MRNQSVLKMRRRPYPRGNEQQTHASMSVGIVREPLIRARTGMEYSA